MEDFRERDSVTGRKSINRLNKKNLGSDELEDILLEIEEEPPLDIDDDYEETEWDSADAYEHESA